jgi:hypothetical protein
LLEPRFKRPEVPVVDADERGPGVEHTAELLRVVAFHQDMQAEPDRITVHFGESTAGKNFGDQ